MKNLNIKFEDKEFKRIIKVKEIYKMNWRNFILKLIEDQILNQKVRNLK